MMNGQVFLAFLLSILLFVTPVAAFDAGDGIALTLGLVILFVGICAGLGWWARRQGAA